MFFLLCHVSLQQNQRTGGQNRFFQEAEVEVRDEQTMYIHVSKCKNDKTKFLKNF
jgi:hypothetical protein